MPNPNPDPNLLTLINFIQAVKHLNQALRLDPDEKEGMHLTLTTNLP